MAKPEPTGRGRPESLDPTAREVVIALVSAGLSRTAAARYLGVSPQTVFNTANRDPEFARRLDRAAAELLATHAGVVLGVSRRNWRASAWALAQLAPGRFTAPLGAPYAGSMVAARLLEALAEAVPAIVEQELGELTAGRRQRLAERLLRAVDGALNGRVGCG